MIKIQKPDTASNEVLVLFMTPSIDKTFMIIYLCTPAPLAGVCHYILIYVS